MRLLVPLLLSVLVAAAAALALERIDTEEDPPGLTDLWDGRASLVLDRKWTSTELGAPAGGAFSGAHIETVDGRWYLFNRATSDAPCAGRGPESRQMGTQVRASTDGGRSWGAPVAILVPTEGTPWACAATDGDAVFDEAAGRWRYLFQCLGAGGPWNGCYAERAGTDPLGAFAAPAGLENPVVPAGSLWSRICDDPGDGCHRPPGTQPVSEEGTFSVVADGAGGWWVGFHGFDGAHAMRGLARTRSFARDDWLVDGAGDTPPDAIIDAADGVGWRENWAPGGPIGAGAGSMLRDGAWHYQLAEIPDRSLNCVPDQRWDLGLFRSRSLGSTTWEQLPGGNPLIYSSTQPTADGRGQPCETTYPGLFRDESTGVTYLMHGRASADPVNDGIYIYRVAWDRNLLENGDFQRAELAGWQRAPATAANAAVERRPDGSPDGTPYLALNCGSAAACDGGQGVYQDVPVEPGSGGEVLAFGGALRAREGSATVDLVAHQLDQAGAVVSSAPVRVDVTTQFAQSRATLRLDARTRALRLQVYPLTPATIHADNLYVIPQDGCDGPDYPRC